LAQTGLIHNINDAVLQIVFGRKGLAIGGYPKDSLHIACKGHQTRIKNILKTPGLNPIEISLLNQRHSSLATAQNSYMEKQRAALEK
jgi:hypothetical protein